MKFWTRLPIPSLRAQESLPGSRPARPVSEHRRRRQRGAEMLETALILGPLLGITFLLLDLSMVICLRSTFQHAVREGVRYAITGQNTPGPCQDDSIKALVKRNAIGFLNSPTATATMHVHWINPVDGTVSNNAAGQIVEVSVEGYQYFPLAPFQRLNLQPKIWARAYDLMETIPGGLPCITTIE
jgi:TadE-like protein